MKKALTGLSFIAFLAVMVAQLSWSQAVAFENPLSSAISAPISSTIQVIQTVVSAPVTSTTTIPNPISTPISSPSLRPILSNILPSLGAIGTRFTLVGLNFTGNDQVYVDNKPMLKQLNIISNNNTRLSFVLSSETAWQEGTQYPVYLSNVNGVSNVISLKVTPYTFYPNNLSSMFTYGVLSLPSTATASATPSVTVNTRTSISLVQNGNTAVITLPEQTVITRTNGSNFNSADLTASDITPSSLTNLGAGRVIKSSLQWGIPNIGLSFSQPITISMHVGTNLNGQTLTILRSISTDSGWTQDGIVNPNTCVVTLGLCSFQATMASYYAATLIESTTVSNSSLSPASPPVCNDQKPASAPQLVSATISGPNQVTLKWSKASDPVTYYLISYGLEPGKMLFGNPNVGGRETTEYTINGLSGKTTYFFKVRAGNSCMPGDYSNEVSVKVPGKTLDSPAQGFQESVLAAQEASKSSQIKESFQTNNITDGQNPVLLFIQNTLAKIKSILGIG